MRQESTLRHPRDEAEGEETESDTSEDGSVASKRLRFNPKEEDIENFSETSDNDNEGEASDEHGEVPLKDHSETSESLFREDEHGQDEEHNHSEEEADEDSSDGDDDDSETRSNSNSNTTVDVTGGTHMPHFFGQCRGIQGDLIDYDKWRADGQSGEVAVEVVLEQGEGKKEVDVVETYDGESDDSEEVGVEWVEAP